MKVFANRVVLGLLAFSLLAWIAAAADVSGTWKGTSIDPMGQSNPIAFNLHENAGTVTGTVDGVGPTVADIVNGKVRGDQISFDVNGKDDGGKPYTMKFSGKVSGNNIQGSFGDSPKGARGGVTVTKQ